MDSLNSILPSFAYPVIVLITGILTMMLLSKRAEQKIKYYGKYIFFIGYFCVTCFLIWPLCLLQPFNVKNMSVYGYMFYPCSVIAGIKHIIRNKQNMPKDGQSCVVVANHQNIWDTLAHLYVFFYIPAPCTILVKKAVFYILPIGIPMWLSGVIFVDRTPGVESTKRQVEDIKKSIKESNSKLWIYSEGTRNPHPEKLLPFKKGAFRIAISCQVPIVPIVISPYYFIDWKEKRFDSGNLYIDILEPIPTKGLTLDDVDTLVNKTHDIMQKRNDELRKEISESYKR